MFSIVIILFVLYFPARRISTDNHEEQHYHEEHHEHHLIPRPTEILHSEYRPPTFRTAVSISVATAAHFMLFAVISVIFLTRSVHQARLWAAWLGVMSMGLAAAQYIPQLWVTWRIKVQASLSR